VPERPVQHGQPLLLSEVLTDVVERDDAADELVADVTNRRHGDIVGRFVTVTVDTDVLRVLLVVERPE
jgi:hypothetical protein